MSSVIVPLAITGGLYAASVALDKFTSGPIDGTQTGWLNGLRVTWTRWRREPNPLPIAIAGAFENLWLAFGMCAVVRWKFNLVRPQDLVDLTIGFPALILVAFGLRVLLADLLPHPACEWFDMRVCSYLKLGKH
jgi:hypothetical protein